MDITQTVRSAVSAKLMELIEEEIDLEENFYDLGGNSMLAIQFLSWIFEHYHIQFNIKDLFEKTISELCDQMLKQQASKVTENFCVS
jgi:acyl carrier protein